MKVVTTRLYHATWARNANSILTKGLLPGGGGIADKNYIQSNSNSVCMCSDDNVAVSFVASSDPMCLEGFDDYNDETIVLFEIDASALNSELIQPDRNIRFPGDFECEFLEYMGSIPPEHLTEVREEWP